MEKYVVANDNNVSKSKTNTTGGSGGASPQQDISVSSEEDQDLQDLLNSTRTLLDTSSSAIPARNRKTSLASVSMAASMAASGSIYGYRPGTGLDDYRGNLLQLAMTPSGSRYLQSALPSLGADSRRALETELLSDIVTAMNHSSATYVVQTLLETTDSVGLERIVSVVTSQFRSLSYHPAGCRVVQKCLSLADPAQQNSIVRLLGNQTTLLGLLRNKNGIYVAQACLPLMSPQTAKVVVNSLRGHVLELGKNQCATHFLQQFLAGQPATVVTPVIDEVLANVANLASDKVGTRLVQSLLSLSHSQVLIRYLSDWISANLVQIYNDKPTMYLIVAVLKRLVGGGMSRLSDLVTAVCDTQQEPGRPLLVTMAVHPVGHLLVKELATQLAAIADPGLRRKLVAVFSKYCHALKSDVFGCVVLKALHGLLA